MCIYGTCPSLGLLFVFRRRQRGQIQDKDSLFDLFWADIGKGRLTKTNGIEGFQADSRWLQGTQRGRNGLTDRGTQQMADWRQRQYD